MPILVFLCKHCHHKFEKIFLGHKTKTTIKCPKCGKQADQTIGIPAKFSWTFNK